MSTTTLDSLAVKTSGRRAPSRRVLIIGVAAVVIAVAGIAFLRAPPRSVSTDNAYLKSDRTAVAPRVRGMVAEVLVADNQRVRKGQPLIRLDAEEYGARVSGAQGDLALADAQVAAARAALARWESEHHLSLSAVRQAETEIRASDAQATRAQSDWRRFESLMGDGTVAKREGEKMRADAVSASAMADRSRAALAISKDQAAITVHRQAELTAALQAAEAQRAKAQSTLALAQQDADHVIIRAPIDGAVGDRQANPGDYVQPGTRLMTLVPVDTLYITANFKETQVERMLQGQVATVKVDALPGVKLKAHVQSFAPGSGSEFALLPFEPGSGNFTKIVQRVPVRLVFEPGQPDVAKLRPGLSAKVSVRLKAPDTAQRVRKATAAANTWFVGRVGQPTAG